MQQLSLFSAEELPVPPGWRIVAREVFDDEQCYRVRGPVRLSSGRRATVELWKTADGLKAMCEASDVTG